MTAGNVDGIGLWVPCRIKCRACDREWDDVVSMRLDPTRLACACGAATTRAWDVRDDDEVAADWTSLAGRLVDVSEADS